MYANKMAVAIKTNGRVLRENKDAVYIKFGSEYAICIKNLNTVRCIVNVFLDGDNMVPGGLVLGVGQTIDLERSIKNGNLTEGNKFKFIERTTAIEEGPRGIKLEDGIVRVEYQFEKTVPQSISIQQKWIPGHYEYEKTTHHNYFKNINTIWGGLTGAEASTTPTYNVGGTLRSVDCSVNGTMMQAQASLAIDNYCADNNISSQSGFTMDWNDAGITVPGSRSDQKFQTTTVGELETEIHSIVLKLLGEGPNNKPVLDPVTVTSKTKCTTCGIQSKLNAKFCAHCGTLLVLYK